MYAAAPREWGSAVGTNVDAARAIYESFASGDIPGFLAALDERVEWVYPPGAAYASQVGPDAVAANVLSPVAEEFSDFTVTVDEYVDGGDVVCTVGRYGGTATATGTPLDVIFVHRLRFTPDGKLARFQEHADTFTIRQTLGR
jgi:ketosteroid isomerase-like protein